MAILMTGLTGVLGSKLAYMLQQRMGAPVYCLVRGGNKRADSGNIYWIPKSQIIDGDITKKNCCISGSNLSLLKGIGIEMVFHAAASVKFDWELEEEISLTNLVGTKNVIALAQRLGAREFHFVSTAYSEAARNPYEISKLAAEKEVGECGLKHSIYRPSVIVGDSRKGEINAFNGYYGVYSGLFALKSRGYDYLPIAVVCSSQSTINLVPIDWLGDMILNLMDLGANNEIYNLTHPNPPNVRWVMRSGFEILEITGIQYCESLSEKSKYKIHPAYQWLQGKVDKILTRYIPYVTEEKGFPLNITKARLGGRWINPPEISYDFLKMLLWFAASRNFGKPFEEDEKKPIPVAA